MTNTPAMVMAGRVAPAPPFGQKWPVVRFFSFVLIVGIVALLAGFVVFVQEVERTRPALTRKAQGIVALTGGADRITEALDVLAAGRADRLLITGVNPSTTREEIARLSPQFRTFSACCIDLGYQAQNTIGNAEETRDWARSHHMRTLIVVTADFHMPRALVEISHAMPEATLTPYPVIMEHERDTPLWDNPSMLRILAFEYVKYLAALARTHLLPGAAGQKPA